MQIPTIDPYNLGDQDDLRRLTCYRCKREKLVKKEDYLKLYRRKKQLICQQCIQESEREYENAARNFEDSVLGEPAKKLLSLLTQRAEEDKQATFFLQGYQRASEEEKKILLYDILKAHAKPSDDIAKATGLDQIDPSDLQVILMNDRRRMIKSFGNLDKLTEELAKLLGVEYPPRRQERQPN